MKEIRQKSPGNSESEAVPFAETFRETLKEGGADAQASEDWTRGGHDRAAVEGPTEAELETRGEKGRHSQQQKEHDWESRTGLDHRGP